MKKRVIHLTETDLKKLIKKLIKEQSLSSDFKQSMSQSRSSGKEDQQRVIQHVKQGVSGTLKLMKQTIITIGKIMFTVIVVGLAIIFLIGNAIYKVSQAIGNSIIKFISSTGKAVIRTATKIEQKTIDAFKSLKISLEKGIDFVSQQLANLKDSSVAIAKWVVNSFKQFGIQFWGKILVMVSGIKELSNILSNYLKTSWSSIQNKVGVAWEDASKWATGTFNAVKQKVSNTADQIGNSIKNKANDLAHSAARKMGSALGYAQGFLSEMYERYLSFSDNTLSILSEAKQYNGKVIL